MILKETLKVLASFNDPVAIHCLKCSEYGIIIYAKDVR